MDGADLQLHILRRVSGFIHLSARKGPLRYLLAGRRNEQVASPPITNEQSVPCSAVQCSAVPRTKSNVSIVNIAVRTAPTLLQTININSCNYCTSVG